MASDIARYEEMASHSEDPQQRKDATDLVPQLKSKLEALDNNEEQQAQSRQADAEEQLRAEQGKLDALNDILERLNDGPQVVGAHPAGSSNSKN